MGENGSFYGLMSRLRGGDDDAAAELHQRYVGRLAMLARRRFDCLTRDVGDPEDVVQSVFKSFFLRYGRGEFDLSDWDAVWRLLARITVNKCRHRIEYLRADRRDIARERPLDRQSEFVDREPSPAETALLMELLGAWLRELEPIEREIVQLGLQGFEDALIASRLRRSERTVRRVRRRVEDRLQELCERNENVA